MKVGKVNSKFVSTDIRFSAGYFLNDDAVNSRVIERNYANCIELGNLATVWNPPIFKRQFCENTERAVPYCQSSDVTNALEGSEVFINKVQAYKVGSVVEDKQILVTGFGTIGNTRLVNELSNGISYANNVCRIKVKDFIPYGYVYAFMTSKYGKSQLNKNASGSVVRYIEAPGIKKTLIPILPGETQQKIHNLIVDAANLRVEANKLLKEAVAIMEEKLVSFSTDATSSFKAKNYSVKINLLKAHNNRLDATYNAGWFDWFYSKLEKADIQTRTVSELSQKVFTPNIFKRVRTDNPSLGIPFLSGSDLLSAFPKMDSLLSKRMSNIENYILKNGWLAIQDAGTIGYVTYIHEFLNGVAATNNLIRIIPKEEENYNPYIFTFLKSKIGQKILASFEFGSVQKHIDNHQLSALKIPVISEIYDTITTKTISSMEFFSKACFNEKTAIDLIEKEIDQWQQL